MEQKTQQRSSLDFSGGLVTLQNIFAVPPNATTNAMDVKFGIGGTVEKRLGSTTINAIALVPATVSGFTPDSGSTLSMALQAFWKLEEAAGQRLDSFDTNPLESNNGPDNAVGIVGNALNLDASNEFLSLNSSPTLQTYSGGFTVSGWVYPTGQLPYPHLLVGKGGNDNSFFRDLAWEVRYQPDRTVSFQIFGGHEASGRVVYFPGNASQTLTNNLISYWKLDESSGTRNDAFGSNHLTSNAGVDFIGAGKQNGAARFVASSSQFLSIGDNTTLETGAIDFTLTAWVYLDDNSTDRDIIVKRSTGTVAEYRLLYRNVTNRFEFNIQGAQLAAVSSNTFGAPNLNTWYHIVAGLNSTGGVTYISVNGGATDTTLTSGSVPTVGIAPVMISADPNIAGSWSGSIDEVGFWKKTLTAAERTALYAVGSGITYYPNGSSNAIVKSNLTLPQTSWTMVTAAFSSANSTMSIQIGTATATTGLSVNWPSATSGLFSMGREAITADSWMVDNGGTLRNQLAAYWKLDERGGGQYEEEVSNSQPNKRLSVINSVSNSVAGKIGSAAGFVAANSQYLTVLTHPDFETGDIDFTLAAWIYMSTTTSSADPFGNFRSIISKRGGGKDEYTLYVQALAGTSGNRVVFQVSSDGTAMQSFVQADSFAALNTGTWYFVTGWHDAVNNRLGVSVNLSVNTSSYANGVKANSATFVIGAGTVGALAFWDGQIDEVAMWKRVLTTPEQSDLYNGATGNTFSVVHSDFSFYGRMDQWGFWNKPLTTQQVADLFGTAGSANTYNQAASSSGWGAFDFGAGFSGGKPLRWLVVAAGTGIYASSNRGVTFVVIATDRGANYQYFERSKNFLIATSETGNKVLYWAGSVGTFMSALAPGSAPPAKHSLDFGGFLLLMNNSAGTRLINYEDNTQLLTSTWAKQFELSAALDDEITDGIFYNQAAYIFTKYTVSRITPVGGNPDFSVRQVRSWGAVPGTVKKVTIQGLGEVIICLGWDKRVRIFDGVEDKIISTQIEQDNGIAPVCLSQIPDEAVSQARAEVDSNEQVYRLFFVAGGSTQTSHAFCLDLRTNAWYPYSNQPFNAAVMADSGNSRILAGISRNGYVHWLNTLNTDVGVPINEVFDSPLQFTSPRTVTKNKKLNLYFSPTSSGTLYYQDRTDFSTTFGPVREKILLADTTSLIQDPTTIDIPMTQNVYQFRLMSSGSVANPWVLTRVDGEHQDLGIGKA